MDHGHAASAELIGLWQLQVQGERSSHAYRTKAIGVLCALTADIENVGRLFCSRSLSPRVQNRYKCFDDLSLFATDRQCCSRKFVDHTSRHLILSNQLEELVAKLKEVIVCIHQAVIQLLPAMIFVTSRKVMSSNARKLWETFQLTLRRVTVLATHIEQALPSSFAEIYPPLTVDGSPRSQSQQYAV